MRRAPLALLLAAAATAAGGVWEEVGRNTDVTVTPSVNSRWAEEGRAPRVGPVAALDAEARLSVPASSLNLTLQAGAARSLDGAPRLDRREVGLDFSHSGERVLLGVGAGYRDDLGENPASPGRSFSEMSYIAYAALFSSPDGEADDWSLGVEVAHVPRRGELRGTARAWRTLLGSVASPTSLDAFLEIGSLHATDADADGAGRTEGWLFAKVSLRFTWMVGQGSSLYTEVASQVATEAPGRAPGVVSLGWQRTF